MMLDRHEAHEELNPKARDPREAGVAAGRPVADREVPLPGVAAADATANVIQQWLDGEASEADARRADARAVDFWMKTSADTDRMRRVKTPSHVMASIMAAIPAKEPSAVPAARLADRPSSEAR
ncbi:MAG: hypothetical protein ACK50C_07460 [Gemmatimonadaceae bacterium]